MQVRGQVRVRRDTRIVEERLKKTYNEKQKLFIKAVKFMQFVNKSKNANGMKGLNCTNENIRVNTKKFSSFSYASK